MKKIISLFQRNYDGDRLVRDELVSGAEWVVAGEGVATTKRDGTACLIKDGLLYRRYDAKCGKRPPPNFAAAQEPDPVTGHWPGWIPVDDSPANQWHLEAFGNGLNWPNGTYELLGPKIQGNPEQFRQHVLVPHGSDRLWGCPRDFDGIKAYLTLHTIEGIVWWREHSNPESDLVKIKRRDFGLAWPVS